MRKFILLILAIFISVTGYAKQPPNFIVVYVDDLGWADTSVEMIPGRADSKNSYYQTPNLARFAKQGLTFSRAYSSAPVCSPARTALQFGTTPARNHQSTLYPDNAKAGEISIPMALKKANKDYMAAHFGKWHVPCISPKAAGYDVSDGPTGNGEGDYKDDMKTFLPEEDPKRFFELTRKSQAFMKEQVQNKNPFYLQVSHYAVHIWHDSLKKTREKYLALKHPNPAPQDLKAPKDITLSEFKHNWAINYAAMIDDLDGVFGDLLKTVDELGIAENTYVIFTSDNGGGFRGNGALRGTKGDLTEGGIRIPMIVRGPNVPKNDYTNVPVVQWDYLATFYELAGGTEALPKSTDGGSLVDVFTNGDKGIVKRNTEELVFHFPWYNGEPETSIMIGDLKLLKNLDTLEIGLYNTATDLGEKKNLASAHPEKKREYEKRLNTYLDNVEAENVTDLRRLFVKNLDKWVPDNKAMLAELYKKKATGDNSVDSEIKRIEGYIKWMIQERAFTQKRIKLHESWKAN